MPSIIAKLTKGAIFDSIVDFIDTRLGSTASKNPTVSGDFFVGYEADGTPFKIDHDNMPGGGTPATTVTDETSFGISSAVGTDTEYARQDHTHGTPTNPVTGHESTYNHTNYNTAYGWGDHSAAGYLTGNQTITITGDVSGSGTTSITLTLASGAVDIAHLSATGTPSATTFLRGDNTWAIPVGGSILADTIDAISLEVGRTSINQYTDTSGNIQIEGGTDTLLLDFNTYYTFILENGDALLVEDGTTLYTPENQGVI